MHKWISSNSHQLNFHQFEFEFEFEIVFELTKNNNKCFSNLALNRRDLYFKEMYFYLKKETCKQKQKLKQRKLIFTGSAQAHGIFDVFQWRSTFRFSRLV